MHPLRDTLQYPHRVGQPGDGNRTLQTGQAENSRLAMHSDQFGLSGDSPFEGTVEIANIVLLARSSLCSQHTKSELKRNPSRAEEDIWSSVASKLTMHSDQMKSGFSGSGNTADLACRRWPMLGSFTRRYLCSHDNGSTIFHRLCDV